MHIIYRKHTCTLTCAKHTHTKRKRCEHCEKGDTHNLLAGQRRRNDTTAASTRTTTRLATIPRLTLHSLSLSLAPLDCICSAFAFAFVIASVHPANVAGDAVATTGSVLYMRRISIPPAAPLGAGWAAGLEYVLKRVLDSRTTSMYTRCSHVLEYITHTDTRAPSHKRTHEPTRMYYKFTMHALACLLPADWRYLRACSSH